MSDQNDIIIAPPTDDGELDAFTPIATQAFSQPGEDGAVWVERFGAKNFRLARVDGKVVGGLGLLKVGQWFGGKRVSMTGVSCVAVAAEYRARGVASALMRSALEEMQREGVALSVLYPATVPLYRRVGYELAGWRIVYELAASAIDLRERGMEVRA